MFDLSSILRFGASHDTMLIKTHKPTFLAETAVAVSALPCSQRADANWQPGRVPALGGALCARSSAAEASQTRATPSGSPFLLWRATRQRRREGDAQLETVL